MVNSKGSPGVNRLARVINDRIHDYMDSQDLAAEFGRIGDDMSLVTDSFPRSIPKGSYFLLQSISGKEVPVEGGTAVMPRLSAGSRVLVVWVGSKPVVLDVVVSSAGV